jgi:hypothetical protein
MGDISSPVGRSRLPDTALIDRPVAVKYQAPGDGGMD